MSLNNNKLATNVNMTDGGGGFGKPNLVTNSIFDSIGVGSSAQLAKNAAKVVGSVPNVDTMAAGATKGVNVGKAFDIKGKIGSATPIGAGSASNPATGKKTPQVSTAAVDVGTTFRPIDKEPITPTEKRDLLGNPSEGATREQKTQPSAPSVYETKPGVIQITQADSDNVVNSLGSLSSDISSNGAAGIGSIFPGATVLLGNIFGAIAKEFKDAGRTAEGTTNTARQGIEAMRNVELQSARRIREEEIPNFRDLNDPNNRQLRDINAEYMAITSEDDHRSVNAGDKDTKEQKISSASKITDKKALTDITSSIEAKEEKYDSTSSIITKELEDILKPSDIDSKKIDDFKDSKNIKLDDAKKEDKNKVVDYDDKSVIGGAASLKNIFKNGGEEEQKIKDSSLITPEELASIVKNSTTDAQNINSSSSISGQVKLSDISGNTSKNVKRDEEEKAEGVNEETLAEATDALTDLGEVGSEHDIMGNELGKTIGDLGPAGDLGVADMMSSMASDVVSSEVGK